MRKMNVVVLVLMSLVVSACKIQIDVPAGAGGSVDTVSGAYACAEGESCQIDVVDIFFDEEFVGTPNPTYFFMEWVEKSRSFCANITVGCRLYTSFFGGVSKPFASNAPYLQYPDCPRGHPGSNA